MRLQRVSHFYAQLGSSFIQNIERHDLHDKNIRLDIKRDDLLHPIVSGNKWRKLKHLLLKIETQGFKKIAVMGGRYSNLIHSLSYLCMLLDWKLELFVRGYSQQELTPMLKDAKRWGAKIHFIDKISYRQFREVPPLLANDVFWISEGGSDALALKGSIESLMELRQAYDYLVIASATGTSLAGYCQAVARMSLNTKVLGVSVLHNEDEILQKVKGLTDGQIIPDIIKGYEFGGYAKSNSHLNAFMNDFEKLNDISLEPVYSGKSFYAVMDLIKNNFFPESSRILLVHCGGLQGKRIS